MKHKVAALSHLSVIGWFSGSVGRLAAGAGGEVAAIFRLHRQHRRAEGDRPARPPPRRGYRRCQVSRNSFGLKFKVEESVQQHILVDFNSLDVRIIFIFTSP